MTDLLSDVDTPSDAELISRVRGGDVAAYGDLFSRHKDAANRLARQLVRGPDADDLVAEAFAKVLSVLQGGGGPDVAFRAYLLTAVRRLHVDRIRSGARVQPTDDLAPFDAGVPFQDTAVAGFESGAAAKAFASLPERWQLVLWHLEVEGQKPADIAPLLGMSANSVSALAYRAREGLRQAFLTMHLSDTSAAQCRWVNEHLGAYVRKGLAKRDAAKVQGHLDECRRCTAMYLELTEVNSNLAGIIAPLLLGAAAAGYAAASSGGAGAAGVVSLIGRARDLALANSGAVTAGAVATGVAAAAVATVVVVQVHRHKPDVVANPSQGVSSVLPSSPAASSTDGAPAASPTTSAAPASTAATPSLSPSPSVSLLPSGTTLPVLPTTAVPLVASPSATDTTVPTDTSSPAPSDPATEPATPPATPPAPTADQPVLSADGTVSVTAHGVSAGDTVGIQIHSASGRTTFSAGVPGSCDPVGADGTAVECHPGLSALAGRFAAPAADAASGDYTVTLPLDYPPDLVDDQVQFFVTINGGQPSESDFDFRPSRTPTFEFSVPAPTRTGHTVDAGADTDRYVLDTTAVLPSRQQGVRYTLTGDARFGAGTDDCTTGDDGSTYTCPDVADGDHVALPVLATGLRGNGTIHLSEALDSDVRFDDPDPSTTAVTLSPGADLGLDLSVASADPDRNGFVALQGRLTGVRPGMQTVTYHVDSPAAFSEGRNPAGCSTGDAGTTLTCDALNGDVGLVVYLPVDVRHQQNDVTVWVEPNTPYESLGNDHTATVTVSGRAEHDFSFTGLHVTRHTVSGRTDSYQLSGTVGDLPAGVDEADLTVQGATRADQQPDERCTATGPDTVHCTGLTADPEVTLAVTSTQSSSHPVTVAVQPVDPYDDPDPDPTPDADTITVAPGSDLTLGTAGTPVAASDDGTYRLDLHLGSVRPDLPSVFLDLGNGATFSADQPDCTRVSSTRLGCDAPVAADIAVVVRADDSKQINEVSLTATPGGDFQQLSGGNTATVTLRGSYDFSLGDLTRTSQTLVGGDTDRYLLHTTVGGRPSGVSPLTLTVAGGRFSSEQPDCSYVDGDHVTCPSGAVGVAVESTTTDVHDVTVALQTPDGYDDPNPDNDRSIVSGLRPGVDLQLADLDPDNESPANDDRLHRVSTRLDHVRPGLDAVTYDLSGSASFAGVSAPRCTVADKSITCDNPVDGPLTFTVRADDVHVATDIRIAASPAAPFLELNDADNSDGVRLLPRPTYDFSMGALALEGHTVNGDTDHYTLGSNVAAVPAGVPGLTFAVTGGTFAAGQDDGCSRVDDTHVTCTGVGRHIGFRVDSTSSTSHSVTITLQVPSGYDDTNAADDGDDITVSPAVDLHLDLDTSANPRPDGRTYDVTTVLTGVRTGPVTLSVTGATVLSSSGCPRVTGAAVRCTDPSEGQRVTFTLRSNNPTVPTAVKITAAAAATLQELDNTDNTVALTLSPDVVLSALTASHTSADSSVRAQVTGVPLGVSTVRVRLSGVDVGTGSNQVRLIGGPSGADGEGPVDCYTSDANGQAVSNGLYATCTGMANDGDGSFYIDMQVSRPPGDHRVTFTVVPVNVNEGPFGDNNSRDLTLG
jgi:RNA polymerase sigma factor (sigma-70 family)